MTNHSHENGTRDKNIMFTGDFDLITGDLRETN